MRMPPALRRTKFTWIAAPAAFVVALGGFVIAADSIASRLQPSLASVSVVVIEPDRPAPAVIPAGADSAGSAAPTVVPTSSDRRSVIAVIPEGAEPLVVDAEVVNSFASSRASSNVDVDATGDRTSPATGPLVPPGVFDADAGVYVDDPDGELAELTSAAASASAAGSAAGHDAVADARAGTAIDDDADVASGAQAYAGARTGGDAAAIAAAVAAAVDNHVVVGEPEVELEAEFEVGDDRVAYIELYADVSVIVLSDDVRGFTSGRSLVIESAILIVRDNEAIIVYADGTTGRVGDTPSTVGTIVSYEQEYSIESEASILGSSGALPRAVAQRLLDSLQGAEAAPATRSGASAPTDEPRAWSDIDDVLDEFVEVMVDAATDPTPDDAVAFTDHADGPADDQSISEGPAHSDPDISEAEAEAEAEAESSASKSGSAASAAGATAGASAVDASGAADATATAEGEAAGVVDVEVESDSAGAVDDDGGEPETATAAATSTEAEAQNGAAVATESSGDDTIELDGALEAATDPGSAPTETPESQPAESSTEPDDEPVAITEVP